MVTPPWSLARAPFEFSQDGLSTLTFSRPRLAGDRTRILQGKLAKPPGSLQSPPFETFFCGAWSLSRRDIAEIHFLQGLHRAREAALRSQAPTSFSDCQVRYHKATPHINHECLGWNRSPVRRSQHRGRRRRRPPQGFQGLKGCLTYLFTWTVVVFYYTSETRNTPLMVLLDALLISGSLHGVHRLVPATYHIAISRSTVRRGWRAGIAQDFF